MVLFGHSISLIAKPERNFFSYGFYGRGQYIGSFAVCCFFFISGLLISQSYAKRDSLSEFILARFHRIYPGSIVSLGICVFFIGPLFSNLSIWSYLTHPQTYEYLFRNLFLWNIKYNLPGVFIDHPLSAVNGSLWSLPLEVRCYLALGFFGLFGGFESRLKSNLSLLCLLCIVVFTASALPFVQDLAVPLRPVGYFLAGCFCYINAKNILINPMILGCLILACVFSFGHPVYEVCFPVASCYFFLFLAYRLPYSKWNEIGDFSYGMYIYAFPIQQIWVDFFPNWVGYQNALASFPTTLALAVASWYLVEKHWISTRKKQVMPVSGRQQTIGF